MTPIQFFLRHHQEILQATLEHIWLVGLTMFFAIAIGVPLGILVTRKPWLSKPILGGEILQRPSRVSRYLGFCCRCLG